jgi:hypothetical protein
VDGMARIIMFIIAAAAIFVVLWMLFWSVVHFLILGFWIVLVAVIGIGLFRVGRRSRARQ